MPCVASAGSVPRSRDLSWTFDPLGHSGGYLEFVRSDCHTPAGALPANSTILADPFRFEAPTIAAQLF